MPGLPSHRRRGQPRPPVTHRTGVTVTVTRRRSETAGTRPGDAGSDSESDSAAGRCRRPGPGSGPGSDGGTQARTERRAATRSAGRGRWPGPARRRPPGRRATQAQTLTLSHESDGRGSPGCRPGRRRRLGSLSDHQRRLLSAVSGSGRRPAARPRPGTRQRRRRSRVQARGRHHLPHAG